ncbi:MAG TPA: hypothetical protein VFV52_17765 [Bacilli bacterium]|nr:hypothetical protein [Bacilli bacterium]
MSKVSRWQRKVDEYYNNIDSVILLAELLEAGFAVQKVSDCRIDSRILAEVAATEEVVEVDRSSLDDLYTDSNNALALRI